jgi:endo-alpha-1,4-polygalactosaminidase (GH114 family)
VDGFFLDNMEIVEHGASGSGTGAPCDRACAAGALALVARLRRAFPEFVIIMQNATSAATREAVVNGVPFPRLLDGVSREEVYTPRYDADAEAELLAWKNIGPAAGGDPLSITTLDYLGNCSDRRRALRVYTRSRSNGFSPYVTISSADQNSAFPPGARAATGSSRCRLALSPSRRRPGRRPERRLPAERPRLSRTSRFTTAPTFRSRRSPSFPWWC